MEFYYFFCVLLLCKVLLLIKQQREFVGLMMFEVMKTRRAQEANLFRGCVSLRSMSIALPLPPTKSRTVWMKVRSKDWWQRVVLLEFSDLEWKLNFRMSRRSFTRLCEWPALSTLLIWPQHKSLSMCTLVQSEWVLKWLLASLSQDGGCFLRGVTSTSSSYQLWLLPVVPYIIFAKKKQISVTATGWRNSMTPR